MTEYNKYLTYLGKIPEFLTKYLEAPELLRLKDISLLCGMDYASKSAYDFAFYVSRYEHSLGTALLTWKLTQDKRATLAALFHDIAAPVFSHVIDYMNGDYINQESTEDLTFQILATSEYIHKCLKEDNLTISDIANFKDYSIVDLERPQMCADRLDNIIAVGMAWIKKLTLEDAKKIIDSVTTTINESNVLEISFSDSDIAEYVKYINDEINISTHTNSDTFMMLHLADTIRYLINQKYVTYSSLFICGEQEIISRIEYFCHIDSTLASKWDLFKNIKEFPLISQPKIKNKILNPIVNGKRLY